MAESYRGLTIRIGGDTTKLTKALHTANQAVTGTTSELKKLNAAVKLDPSSIQAASLQIGAMASSASATAMRLAGLRDAMRQVGELKYGDSTVKELADGTKNAQLNAELAQAAYNKLDEQLASMYTTLTAWGSKATEVGRIEFGESLKKSFDEGKLSAESITAALEKLPSTAIQPSEKATENFIKKVVELQQQYAELTEKAEKYRAAEAAATDVRERTGAENGLARTEKQLESLRETLNKTIDRFSQFQSQTFNFDNENTDIKTIRATLESMPDSIRPSQVAIDAFVAEVARLKTEFGNAKDELEKANIIAQFQSLTNEIVKSEASIKNINQAISDMKLPSDLMRGMYEQTESAKALGEAYAQNMQYGEKMAQAYKMNPDNAEAMAEAEKAFGAALMNANEQAEQQAKIVKGFESSREEIDSYTDSTKSAAQQLLEMSIAHSKASEKVSLLEGNIAHAEEIMAKMKGTASELAKDLAGENEGGIDTDIANEEEYQRRAEQVAKWRVELEGAKADEEELSKSLDMSKARKELEEAEYRLVASKSAAEQATAELVKLSQVNPNVNLDVSSAEQFKNALKEINSNSNSGMLGQLGTQIDAVDAALSSCESRLRAVNNALKLDPKNTQLLEQRTALLNEKLALSVTKSDKLKEAIKQLDSSEVQQMAENFTSATGAVNVMRSSIEENVKVIEGYESTIKSLTEELNKINSKPLVTEEDKQNAANLVATISALYQQLMNIKSTTSGNVIEFADASKAAAVERFREQLAQLGVTIDDTKRKAQGLGETDATPRIDDAAFMQAVNMMAQSARRMLSEIVDSANTIDSAYRDMRKTVNGTESEFEALRSEAIEFSQSHFTSADTILEMEALGGQLGIVTEDLKQFGEITSNLDIATDMNSDQIALALGQMANVLDLDIDGMQRFSDVLVRLGNNMPAQESAIMSIAQRLASVASISGFSAQEVLAWSGAIASTGQRSESAATAINKTIGSIESAVAGGGDKLKQFALIAGMSADQFADEWRDKPTEALKQFIKGLASIDENNESAIAALEALGITSVRQEQALLALTKTIGSLDESLAMSASAWGDAEAGIASGGDAAREAQNKSEGFSGALGILKNNVDNLMASFGDGLVPAMKAASSIIAVITDALNAMPAPLKSVIVGAGAVSIALGAIVPVINVLSSGWGKLITAFTASNSVGQAVASLLNISTAATAASGAVAAGGEAAAVAGASFGGPLTLGIAAALVAVTGIIAAVHDWNEKQKNLNEATTGLTSAMENGVIAFNNYSEAASNAGVSVKQLGDDIYSAIEAQAQLAQTMSEDWGDIGTDEAAVDAYVKKIEELTEKQHLNAEEQAELIAAVNGYNEITGSSISVIDAATGSLDKSNEAIEKNSSAWKNATEWQQALEHYNNLVKQQAQNDKALTEAKEKLGNATKDESSWFVDMRENANSVTGSYSTLESQVRDLERASKSNAEAQQQALDKMQGASKDLTEIERALNSCGDSLSNYGKLTATELAQVVMAWDGTAASVQAALQKITSASGGMNIDLGELDSMSTTSRDAEYKSAKSAFDAEYKNAQRQYDAIYKARQRELDAAYKAQQKAYDAEYKAQQKAYDREYKAQQKAYDNQYKALQKKLDAEYKSRKDSYDRQLKALKDSQDREVKEFQKATDTRLKEMEREYKEKLKLIEGESDARIAAIDAQIKALEDQTTAEKRAIERRNENDKIAELKNNVEKAKSRRKRAEAEKELNDYLQDVEAKRNEESRKDEIERLKEQKQALKDEVSDRKAALKEQYDAEIAAYKESRAERLEAIKTANTVEYEARKADYDARLEALKEHHTAQLESLKEYQTAQLESLKESQQAQLEALKEAQQTNLEAMKDAHQTELDNLKQSQQDQLDALKQSQHNKLDAIMSGESAQTDALKKSADDQDNISKSLSDRLATKASSTFNDLTKKTSDGMGEISRIFGEGAKESERNGKDAGDKYSNAFERGIEYATKVAQNTSRDVRDELDDTANWTYDSGSNAGSNFERGLASWQDAISTTARNIASGIASFLHFSVPDKGPLHDEDEWGGDLVQNLIEGMRERERELSKQAARMARAIEDGFDPELTVDAAYEAIDKINKSNASIEAQQASAGKEQSSVKLEVNINISGVSMRSDTDIEKFAEEVSRRMAAATARQFAGRLG